MVDEASPRVAEDAAQEAPLQEVAAYPRGPRRRPAAQAEDRRAAESAVTSSDLRAQHHDADVGAHLWGSARRDPVRSPRNLDHLVKNAAARGLAAEVETLQKFGIDDRRDGRSVHLRSGKDEDIDERELGERLAGLYH